MELRMLRQSPKFEKENRYEEESACFVSGRCYGL